MFVTHASWAVERLMERRRCCYAMCTRPTTRDRGHTASTTGPRGPPRSASPSADSDGAPRPAASRSRFGHDPCSHTLRSSGTGVSIDSKDCRLSCAALCIESCRLQSTSQHVVQHRAPYLPYFRRPRPFTVKPCLASPPLPHRCAGTAGEWPAPHLLRSPCR